MRKVVKFFVFVFLIQGVCFPQTFEELKKRITSSRDLERRQAVYEVAHSTLSFAPQLLELALESDDIFTKRMAVSGLGNFITLKSFEILHRCLRDELAVIRADAIVALANFPKDIIQDEILKMLDDTNFIVIKESLKVIGKLKIMKARTKLLKLLDEKSEIIRTATLNAIAELQIKEAFEKIKEIFEKENSLSVKKSALFAMSKIDIEKAYPILRENLENKDIKIALYSAFVLAQNMDTSGKDIVKKALKNPDPQIRIEAAKVLLYYDTEESKTLLKGLLNDPDSSVRNFVKNNFKTEEEEK